MRITSAAEVAAAGMARQTRRVYESASRISAATVAEANVGSPSTARSGVTGETTLRDPLQDGVDLVAETLTQMQAKRGYEANLQVFKTAVEMERELLDRLA